MRGSIVVPCLCSHEVVRRQVLWLNSWFAPFADRWDVIVVDDGSSPPITPSTPENFKLRVIRIPPHPEKWTQPRARNTGARASDAEHIFFVDVDHVVTPEIMLEVDHFDGDKMFLRRTYGALDEDGHLLTTREELLQFGAWPCDLDGECRVPRGNFVIRHAVHDLLGGCCEEMCGRYYNEDLEYAIRYNAASARDLCRPAVTSSNHIYVFPNPALDRLHLFHNLPR